MDNILVIFDMDGTLVDTRADITISINYVRKTKNLPPLTEEEVIKIINFKREELAKQLYHTETYLPEDRAIFEEHYKQQCSKNVRPYEGIVDLLDFLKSSGVKLSVATNAPTKFGERILSAAKIDHYFDHIVGSCKVKNAKPEPDMIYLIQDFYSDKNLNKNFLVGDNHTDINAAKNANIPSIFVKWGYGSFDGVTPDFTAETPEEIVKYILNEKVSS
jgi:phosphoglycolate phosphatase